MHAWLHNMNWYKPTIIVHYSGFEHAWSGVAATNLSLGWEGGEECELFKIIILIFMIIACSLYKNDVDLAQEETYCYTTGKNFTYKSWFCILCFHLLLEGGGEVFQFSCWFLVNIVRVLASGSEYQTTHGATALVIMNVINYQLSHQFEDLPAYCYYWLYT